MTPACRGRWVPESAVFYEAENCSPNYKNVLVCFCSSERRLPEGRLHGRAHIAPVLQAFCPRFPLGSALRPLCSVSFGGFARAQSGRVF